MMLPKTGSRYGDGNGDGDDDGSSNSVQLLRDIEAISKALYLQKTPQRNLVFPSSARSKSVEKPRLTESKSSLNPISFLESASFKDKKSSSAWNWKKPLKSLAHIGHQRFNICFFLHVHSIEGLPPSFNDISLSVNWKRKNLVLRTRPSKALKGIAEFDETLMHKCSVYGSKSGPLHSAKYELKLFLIYASIIGAPGFDMGKHWVDLTRLLPLNLVELEGEESTGKWTTSFKLAGKAKDATLNVSFGFSVLKDNFIESSTNESISELVNLVHDRSCAVDSRTGLGRTNSNVMLRRVGSVPSNLNHRSPLSSQSVDVKIYDEVSPNLGSELSKSINFLYEKLDQGHLHCSEELDMLAEHIQQLKPKFRLDFEFDKDNSGKEYDNIEFTVIEQGIEIEMQSKQAAVQTTDGSPIETIHVDEIINDVDIAIDEEINFHSQDTVFHEYKGEVLVDDRKHDENSVLEKGPSMEDMESAFNNLLIPESAKLESQLVMNEFQGQENYMKNKSHCKANKVAKRSLSLDNDAEFVASDFLNMLGIEHSPYGLSSDSDPDSPRERLLREFEEEAFASGSYIIDFDGKREHEEDHIAQTGSDGGDLFEDFDLSLVIHAAEEEHQMASKLLSRRRKVKLLEDLETEALMQEWGLNEDAFQNSPRYCSDGFGSPIELPPEDPVELPPLGNGFGPFIHTKDGGCLRSMNPSLFRNSKNAGRLSMQVSCPVVLPAKMGSDIMEILQHLTLVGIEKLSLLANNLMPLEDINGKMLQQIAEDVESHRQASLHQESLSGQDPYIGRKEVEGFCSCHFINYTKCSLMATGMDWDHVTLEDLAPLAMNKIDAMSIEGLRIQSGMSDEEAPSSVRPQSLGRMLAFKGKSANRVGFLGLEEGAESHQVGAGESNNDADELLGLSVTLEEWLMLDAGIIGDEDEVSKRTIRILAAHHAKCIDSNGSFIRDISWDEASGRKHGLLGNNLTVAVRILLRDPFRNYEPVGASMLALIQVERSFPHPMPKVYRTVLERSSDEEEHHGWFQRDDRSDNIKEEERKEGSPLFKVTEVHLSGLNTEPDKMQVWGARTQQQSGTRWLHASGMSKPSKHPFSKSKAIVVAHPQFMRKAQTSDLLWSISSQACGTESYWKELGGSVPYVRNPNVIFPS